MNREEALQQLEELQKKRYAYFMAYSMLDLDAATVAPRDTAEGRGVARRVLAGEELKLIAGDETDKLLRYLEDCQETLGELEKRQVKELRKQYNEKKRIPAEEYIEYAGLISEAGSAWRRAKEKSDFELFRPVLEKMVAIQQKFAGYYAPEKKPYDALLDQYEPGMDMDYLDEFFRVVRERLVPLIQAASQAEQVDDSFLHDTYPVEDQRRFSDYLMEVLGLDREHCTIGETEHPFTQGFNNKDVRITTNYKTDNVADSMYSVIHEGGHAKYELGTADELAFTCLAGGVSTGVHESQSRFYENIIGRSRAFVTAILPKMKEFFPEQLADVTAEQMYRAVNKAQPSLIRTEADELTYSLHVMVRYELEKRLFDGSLQVKDIPGEWNRLYREYLGVDVPDDRSGCLQDCHWSDGMFGYFPSYALGSAYGAQMLKNMEKDIDVWGQVEKGDLSGVSAWLRDKVHRFGSAREREEIVKGACGGEFDPTVYTDYLTEKYEDIYKLK